MILTQPQAAAPQEFQAAEIVADGWRAPGPAGRSCARLPGQQFNQVVWYERQRWDATMWRMVGRPERSDPDELTLQSLPSRANAANGYDFVGYINPEYDKLAEAQREELDPEKRKALIFQAQEMINRDQPLRPSWSIRSTPLAFNKTVWNEDSDRRPGRHRHPQLLDLHRHRSRSARRRT